MNTTYKGMDKLAQAKKNALEIADATEHSTKTSEGRFRGCVLLEDNLLIESQLEVAIDIAMGEAEYWYWFRWENREPETSERVVISLVDDVAVDGLLHTLGLAERLYK